MRRFWAVLVVVGATIGLAPTAAHAAAPANDQYANAEVLAASGTLVRSNIGATISVSEPVSACCDPQATIWFTWTAPTSGRVTFDSWGSDIDTVLAAYTGNTQLSSVEVASDDDLMGCDTTSFIQFDAVAGTKYHIQLGSWDDMTMSANLHLTWNWARTPFRVNDDVANATALIVGATPVNLIANTAGATAEEDNWIGEILGESTTWYKVTVASPGLLTLGLTVPAANNPYGQPSDVTAEVWDNSDIVPDQLASLVDGDTTPVVLDHAGTYYIRMYSPMICSGGAFTLSRQFVPGTAVVTGYTIGQYDLISNAATKLGITVEQLQHDGVLAWKFIYGLTGNPPQPITNLPDPGSIPITSIWSSADLPALNYMATGWQMTQDVTQQTAALGLAFLAAFS